MSQQDEIKTIRAAKDAAARLTTTEHSLRERHASLLSERATVEASLCSLEECSANSDRLVDAEVERWTKEHSRTLIREISGPTDESGSALNFRLVKRPPRLPSWGGDSLDFRTLCALLPDVMKARLREILRGSSIPFGLPADARIAKLAELDGQIAAVESQHTELVDAAAECGITLRCLDVVRERRDAKALEETRDRERAAQRATGLSHQR